MLLNCGVGKGSWDSLRLQEQTSQFLHEIRPEYSSEGLMLKLQYFGHLMWRTVSLEKTLIMGKIEGRRRSGWQQMRWLDGITDWMYMEFDGQGSLVCCTPWDCKKSNTTEQLNCTEQSKSHQFSYIQKYIRVQKEW